MSPSSSIRNVCFTSVSYFARIGRLHHRALLLSVPSLITRRKEGNALFNNAFNTFYLRLYGIGHMVKDHSDREREETLCYHMVYSFRLAARVLLYASSHRLDNTYHGICYTRRGAMAGTRNSSMGPP